MSIKGVKLFNYYNATDSRGSFSKAFEFKEHDTNGFRGVKEIFSSRSNAGVWRGMHLQVGSFASNRIIYCNSGRAKDYLLDLRHNSSTLGETMNIQFCSLQYSSRAIFVPAGVAHGFLSEENGTEIFYITDAIYSAEHDTGVNVFTTSIANSLPSMELLDFSERDAQLLDYNEFLKYDYKYE